MLARVGVDGRDRAVGEAGGLVELAAHFGDANPIDGHRRVGRVGGWEHRAEAGVHLVERGGAPIDLPTADQRPRVGEQ